jgi:hypothetical protein
MLKSLQFFLVVEDVPKFSSHLVARLTILEHGGVDQPLEVRNSFSADEETLGTKHFLLENGLDVALRGGSEVAHSLTPAKDEVICCCKQLVEGPFISCFSKKRSNTQIVCCVWAKLPVRKVACRQLIVNRKSEIGEQNALVSPSA